MRGKKKVRAKAHITTEESILLNLEMLNLQREFPERRMSMEQFLNNALRLGIEMELEQIREKRRKEGWEC